MRLGAMLRGFAGGGMRGRISKVSVLADGSRSVVIRFGGEEPGAKDLKPGVVCEMVVDDKAEKQPKSALPRKRPVGGPPAGLIDGQTVHEREQ